MARRKALTGIACLVLFAFPLISVTGCYSSSIPTSSETWKKRVLVEIKML